MPVPHKGDRDAVARIREGQTDDHIRIIYESMRHEPKVKWKESIKRVVGLEISARPGMDR